MSPPSTPIRRRPLRAGLLSLAAILALLVALVWIVPGLLDWNRYRASIASLVAAGIGRPVRIDGDITLSLLPQPFLTATDLHVDDSGDGVTMQVQAVRLRVALGPLIAGRVDARELTLQGADLRLPWPPPTGALARRPPAWLTSLQARLEESRLQVGNLVLTGTNAALGADPETGTLSAVGSATLFDTPARFTVRLGRPGRDGAAPLDVSLDGQDKLRDTAGTISGAIEADGSLGGRVTARGRDLSQLLPAPAMPWRADGRISATGGLLVADELALEIGGTPARGVVALRVQPELRLDLALAAGRLNLDAWTPVLLRAAQPGRGSRVPTGLDMTAESATLAGGSLRQVRAAVDIDKDGLSVREAGAILPGDAQLTLHGRFPRPGAIVAFAGDAALVAPDLRATLQWLEPIAPAIIRAVPPAALRAVNLRAKLAADPAQLSLTDLAGTLDGAALEGGLALRLGARPSIGFGLTLDRLLLDPFLPDRALLERPAAAYAAAVKALASAGFDSDMKLQVREADWRGAHFGPLAFDVQSEAGHLTVRRLEATLAGLHMTASGTLGDAGRLSEGRLELSTQEVAPLRPFLPAETAGLGALLKGPANLLLTGAGPPDALALRGLLELDDLRAEIQPVLNIPAHRWAGSLTLHHPGASRLLGRIGFGGSGAWLGDGSFSLIAQAAKVPGRLDLTNLELVAGQERIGGQLALVGHALSGRLKAETLALPPLDPRSPDPLPIAMLGSLDGAIHLEADRVLLGLTPVLTELTANVGVQNGTLAVDDLAAKRDSATVSATLRLQPSDPPHVTLHASVTGAVLDGTGLGGTLDLTGGTVDANAALTADGFSPAALIATLTGTAMVSVHGATVNGFDLAGATDVLTHADSGQLPATLRAFLLTGASTFKDVAIPFDLSGGIAAVRAAGQGAQGGATLTGTFDLQSRTLDGYLTLLPGAGLPPLPIRLSGPATNPVRTPELATAARWLAERP